MKILLLEMLLLYSTHIDWSGMRIFDLVYDCLSPRYRTCSTIMVKFRMKKMT